jgi:hypothetical protein
LSDIMKSQNYTNGLELMKSISLNTQTCYQSMIDRGNAEEYYVCAVITVNDKKKFRS